jgi:predicted nucleic acid-binding protein
MTSPGRTPLFVDTGAFYARFVENAPRHERAMAVFDGIWDGSLSFKPLYTSVHVLAELATLLLRKARHAVAVDAVDRVRRSGAVRIVYPDESTFAAACRSFERFDDQQITLVDHASAAIAARNEVEHVFGFDDDFRTLGLQLVPEEVDVE